MYLHTENQAVILQSAIVPLWSQRSPRLHSSSVASIFT